MNKTGCIEEIQKITACFRDGNDRVKDAFNEAIKKLSDDLYNKGSHFILELIQNAEDNNYTNNVPLISFRLTKNDPTGTKNSSGALIIQNNEDGFLYNNIDAICSVGRSTKKKSQGYIGEKGIGFKSVFKITTCPYIVSNGYSFSLPEKDEETGFGYIVPRWWNGSEKFSEYSGTTIILPLDREKYDYTKIESMLESIEPATILFLSRIKTIKIETDSGDNFSISKDDSKLPMVKLQIDSIQDKESVPETRKFMYFSKKNARPREIRQENRDNIEEREVMIAYPLDNESEVSGRVFAYLSTDFKSGFPFLVNADFILTSGRSEIKGSDDKKDCPWNEWLWECAAICAAGSLKYLAEQELLTVERLNALVSPLNSIDENSVLYPFFRECRAAFMKEALFKTATGFSNAGEAMIVGSSELLGLFGDSVITGRFFERKHWLDKRITSSNTQLSGLYKFLRGALNIPDIDFSRFLDEKFLIGQSDQWMIEFYLVLKGRSEPEINKVKNKPIIRAVRNGKQTQVTPFAGDKRNVYISDDPDVETSEALVKTEILK